MTGEGKRGPPPRFAADAMLGSLARWLRLLGYDTTYSKDVKDDDLLAQSKAEGRVVLTRDRRVAARAAACVFVGPGTLDDELAAVFSAISAVPPEEPPAVRCTLCNALLEAVEASALPPGAVPPRVVELGLDLWRCPACRRLYWRGSHVDSMAVRLKRVRARLAHPGPSAPPGQTVK
jgi:uncharacterized protein with PIN domain